MIYEILFSPQAEKSISKWKKSNPMLHSKLLAVLHELSEHPRTGLGHPEPLKGGSSITYSRRISSHDRIIYDIYDDVVEILIIKVEGHYSDK